MAEYLRFQLNTAPHVSLSALVGETGAYIIKARFQLKVRNSNSLLSFGMFRKCKRFLVACAYACPIFSLARFYKLFTKQFRFDNYYDGRTDK